MFDDARDYLVARVAASRELHEHDHMTRDQRRALRRLADVPRGVAETLMLAHGFSRELITGLVLAGHIDLALAMISVLVFMTIAIPLALWRANVTAQRSNASSGSTERKSETLDTWLQGQFATCTDQEKGSTAAIEILLPLAAVAFGITRWGSCSN